ncbi:FAD-dependent sensor of blue light [Yoonia sediminilitoris]|uniref:FAD-dependent sensor of blue light n=2 Tax=Yoonia sediminilitoris TaxID=1286148 RepID=A0A2T6KKF4_9RHOB|nr:FAD-dependent sensor of blue light [Yoonia sediminilitoris]RCW96793.1 FAD-dependent sensor of blue light [Yoonia sediminilitoris]
MRCFWKYAYFSDVADHSDDVFREILRSSRKNNQRSGVSGILVRDKNTYFQYLEGDKEALADCVLRISGDSRHNNMTVIFSAQTAALFFDGWSLAEAKLPQRKQNLSAFKRLLLGLPMEDRIAMVDEVCLEAKLLL